MSRPLLSIQPRIRYDTAPSAFSQFHLCLDSEAIKNHLHKPQLQRPPTNKPSPKVDAGIPFPRVPSHPPISQSRQPILCQASCHRLHATLVGLFRALVPSIASTIFVHVCWRMRGSFRDTRSAPMRLCQT
ncbi:hypothetical protein FVEG_16204 [Fusarium verticillioides 7600]|uniref:Uncharacterized protein n=1 Tax=Gibberella moniliformis (strain M3125 / FGSC 7600) TaxID=334819 RepID=W7MJX0_GIBM7|nr:hypothetical protein FVEG_16204 [Fusarium verticillioides 7600]EWG47890.1 hypothetical protein FVEG_16204 [Fusarium verticillioides 7600]